MRHKKIFLNVSFLLFCIFVFASPLFADNSYIQNYKIDVKVNKNNTFDVNEGILYYFDTPSQGIFRVIPTRGYDNSKIKVVNFEANTNIAGIEKTNSAISYILGTRGTYLTGHYKYNICYIYDIGEDRYKGFDAFYYNLIGSSWDVPILRAEFSIEFPPDVDLENGDIKFYRGFYGATSTNDLVYNIDKNRITGYAKNLRTSEALTILVGLEDGYFVGARKEIPLENILLSVLMAMLISTAISSVVMYIKSPRSRFLTLVVSAYPPSGITPLDARFLYKKQIDSKALCGAILNFAEKGYISIEFNEKKNSFSKDVIVLHKKKEADDTFTREERILFSALFKKGEDADLSDSALMLGETLSSIQGTLSAFYSNGEKAMYERASVKKYHRLIFVLIVEVLISLVVVVLSLSGTLGISALPSVRLAAFITFIIAFIIQVFVICKIRRKSEFYASVSEQLLGLKDFIETVEKEKLETLIGEDPHYFYKTLAYAIPLECEKKWTSKFEKGIKLEQPEWLYGNFSVFDYVLFTHFYRSFYSYVPMNAKVSNFNGVSKGGGGLSMGGGGLGGGFSGGGFGGGGGGRW